MADEKAESQVEGTGELTDEAGEALSLAQGPQPAVEAPVAERPGAEEPAPPSAPPPKTYTEVELREREAQITSTLQAETARYKQQADKAAMQQEIQGLILQEQQAQAKDQHDIAQGLITETDAQQRQTLRAQSVQAQLDRATLAQDRAQVERYMQWAGRFDASVKYAKKYGLDYEMLVNDSSLTDVARLVEKAADLALARKDAEIRAAKLRPETFDQGPSGGLIRGSNADRVIKGYAEGDPGVSRAAYEKAMREKGLL